ncbi:MAG: glycosyltransferase family 4 protein [Bacteroidota bacterium]
MAGKKIKVAYISHFPHMRMGGQRSMYFLISELNREHFQPFAVTPGPGELTDSLKAVGCPVYHTPLSSIKLKYINKLSGVYSGLREIFKEQRPDIIHPDYPADMFFSSMAKKGLESKLIWHVRWNARSSRDKLYEKLADGIIGVSDAAGRRFFDDPSKSSKYRTIYNGVDTRKFSPTRDKQALRNELGLPLNSVIIMFAGVLKEGKGVFDLLKAAAILRDKEVMAKKPLFIFIGSRHGEETHRNIEELKAKAGDDIISIYPQQTNIQEWMKASDILAIPSHEGNEGMPRVMYEAMACGIPVIGTNTGGINEGLSPENGLLVRQEAPQELAEALTKLILDDDLREKMGIAGRDRALDLFDIKKHARRVEDFYFYILDKKAGEK